MFTKGCVVNHSPTRSVGSWQWVCKNRERQGKQQYNTCIQGLSNNWITKMKGFVPKLFLPGLICWKWDYAVKVTRWHRGNLFLWLPHQGWDTPRLCVEVHRASPMWDKYICWKQNIPADTLCNNNVTITSKRRRFDVIMTLLLHSDV